MSDVDERSERLQRRARDAFDESVAMVDEETRARLRRARREAIANAGRPSRPAWRLWVPAAAAASIALVGVLLWHPVLQVSAPIAGVSGSNDAVSDPVELLAAGEDFELAENDLEFYEWLDANGFDVPESEG